MYDMGGNDEPNTKTAKAAAKVAAPAPVPSPTKKAPAKKKQTAKSTKSATPTRRIEYDSDEGEDVMYDMGGDGDDEPQPTKPLVTKKEPLKDKSGGAMKPLSQAISGSSEDLNVDDDDLDLYDKGGDGGKIARPGAAEEDSDADEEPEATQYGFVDDDELEQQMYDLGGQGGKIANPNADGNDDGNNNEGEDDGSNEAAMMTPGHSVQTDFGTERSGNDELNTGPISGSRTSLVDSADPEHPTADASGYVEVEDQ